MAKTYKVEIRRDKDETEERKQGYLESRMERPCEGTNLPRRKKKGKSSQEGAIQWRLSEVEIIKIPQIKPSIKEIRLSHLLEISENYTFSAMLGSEIFLESRIGVCMRMGAQAEVDL